MTLHSKLIYKYREADLTRYNYESELDDFLKEFFKPLDCSVLYEIKDAGKYLLLIIHHRNVSEEILIDYAIRLGQELDMDFQNFIKEVDYYFEDDKKIDVQINEYRIVYERRHTVA